MLSEDILYLSVHELGEQIRSRKISPVELTESYLARLEKLGPRLGAVATLTPDLAREQARAVEKEIATGHSRGPLHGIPYGAKDLLATRGIPTTWGAPPFKDQMFNYDATLINKLREAGAILVAKLAMIELAGGGGYNDGNASLQGPSRCPYNLEHWAGGGGAIGARGVRDWLGDARLDHHPVGVFRRKRAASHLRPRQPPWSHGALVDHGQTRTDVPQRDGLRPGAQRHCRARSPRWGLAARDVRLVAAALVAGQRLKTRQVAGRKKIRSRAPGFQRLR